MSCLVHWCTGALVQCSQPASLPNLDNVLLRRLQGWRDPLCCHQVTLSVDQPPCQNSNIHCCFLCCQATIGWGGGTYNTSIFLRLVLRICWNSTHKFSDPPAVFSSLKSHHLRLGPIQKYLARLNLGPCLLFPSLPGRRTSNASVYGQSGLLLGL